MRLLLLILSALAAAIAFLPAAVHADVAATPKPTPTPAPCVCDDVLQATIAADDAWLGRCLRASPQLDLSCAQGQTSLTIAATLGHTRLVSLLLGHARAPRLTVAADESAYLPLHVAVQNGHVEVVRLLLARMPPGGIDLQTAGKYTALHFAVESKRKEIVHMLLSQPRPANVNVQEADGATPLILAVDSGDEAIVSLLLQHTPAPHLEYQGLHERVTAFTLACMKGYTGMVRLLLAQRPPPNTEIRSKFQTSVRYLPRLLHSLNTQPTPFALADFHMFSLDSDY
jgi:ankyrin repeat protein